MNSQHIYQAQTLIERLATLQATRCNERFTLRGPEVPGSKYWWGFEPDRWSDGLKREVLAVLDADIAALKTELASLGIELSDAD